MGFGYLLIGYFMAFAFSLANVYFFFDILGGLILFVGLSKLAPHGKNFYRGMWVDLLYIVLCLVRVSLSLFRIVDAESWIHTALAVLVAVVTLLLQFFILAGIYYIAERAGAEKEQSSARRCILYILLYYFLYIALYVLAPVLGTIANFISLGIMVFGFVVLFMHLALIYSCYCRICLEGQESGERPVSRYAFVNRFHEKWDAIFDGAYLRKKEAKPEPDTSAGEEQEPGYRRVKRKKKSRRK